MPTSSSRNVALLVAMLCVAGCARETPPQSAPEASATTATGTPADSVEATPAAPARDTAAKLKGYQWQLRSATDAGNQSIAAFFPSADKPLGLLFEDSAINVTGSCNRLRASYEVAATGELQARPGPTTMMACPPPEADADAAIARFLSGTLQLAVEVDSGAPLLRLTAADGTSLLFYGTPTPEARFGGPGVRAFLEVSTEPCAAPAEPSCLMVRDLQFDEKGLPSGTPGAWRALPQGIEGYKPVAGQHQVVRVKRFEEAGTAGSTPTEHFIFDMVVESRTAQ